MIPLSLSLALLAGCRSSSEDISLSIPLSPIESRAGEIQDESALFSGVSAEGQIGDFKLYNNRVQFIIQGFRPGNYYVPQAGAVVDADIIRPPGALGHDAIDEWAVNAGVGRLMDTEKIYVLQAGGPNQTAIIRAEGPETSLSLLEQAIESPGFIPTLGLWIRTDYILEPNSYLLRVETTATANRGDALISPGDLLLASQEVGSTWSPETGLQVNDKLTKTYMGYQGYQNQVALGIFPDKDRVFEASGMDVFSGLLDLASAFYGPEEIKAGDSLTWARYYGVGPDLATLTQAWQKVNDIPTEIVEGTVTAPDGNVGGARVNISVDGAPFTYAVTDANGEFRTTVPADSEVSLLADGRGRQLFPDLPDGATPYSPYTGAQQKKLLVEALSYGATSWLEAKGRGIGTSEEPLVLGVPAKLIITSDDGLPFQATLNATEADPTVDPKLIYKLVGSNEAVAWSIDGDVEVSIEPGEYTLTAHRGVRFETHSSTVTLEAGQTQEVTISLPQAYEHDGWLAGDPHCHAAPSPDAHISMEERIVVQAGLGIQLHFGTDHDHVADYNPIVDALGLSDQMTSIVGTEVSPVLRGHLNAYPISQKPNTTNGGAYPWWLTSVADTTDQFNRIHEQFGDFILQVNHPVNFGLADASKWSPGYIDSPSFWSDQFQVLEILNSGHTGSYLPVYYDLVSRGYPITPVGVSDSHAHLSGGQGYNLTFLEFGFDKPSLVTDESLKEVFRGQRTIVSRGPFLDLSITPGSLVNTGAELIVNALSPSWIVIDRIKLVENGTVIQTIDGTTATFTLNPEEDAFYNIIAEGDTPMLPVTTTTPWSFSSPIYVDTGSDGWTPPLPDLTLKE